MHAICTIHTDAYKYSLVVTTYKYIPIKTHTENYLPILHTIHIITYKYTDMQIQTSHQHIPYIPIHTKNPIQVNTD